MRGRGQRWRACPARRGSCQIRPSASTSPAPRPPGHGNDTVRRCLEVRSTGEDSDSTPFELETEVIITIVALMRQTSPRLSLDIDRRLAVFGDDLEIIADAARPDRIGRMAIFVCFRWIGIAEPAIPVAEGGAIEKRNPRPHGDW